jgi:hypothetical protein
VVYPTPDDVELVADAARRAGFVPFVGGVRYSEAEVESFRRAGEAAFDRTQLSPAHDVLRAYGPDVEANGVRLTISEANATVVADLLAVMPADVLEIEVNDIRAVALWGPRFPIRSECRRIQEAGAWKTSRTRPLAK